MQGGEDRKPDSRAPGSGEAPGQDLHRAGGRGFDFLGYHFRPEGLRPAPKTVARLKARLRRLYEQQPTAPNLGAALGEHVGRWLRWVTAALHEVLAVWRLDLPTHCTHTNQTKPEQR